MKEEELVRQCMEFGKEHSIAAMVECLCKTLIVATELCGQSRIEMECEAGRVEVEFYD